MFSNGFSASPVSEGIKLLRRRYLRGPFKPRAIHKLENAWEYFKNKYSGMPLAEKILDALLFIAVLASAIFLLAEHAVPLRESTREFIHHADLMVGLVFLADLGRSYFKTNHWAMFLRYHWLDVGAALIVLLAFSSLYYPAIGRINYLLRTQKLHKVTKFYHLKHAGKNIS
ncbi:hypothetical protein D6764_03805 [Candidatus Woesearchaeota archaeon]|nr:MAG: hypothetical protein D6764_03805 [Candidatus Woesearchaeota archaeon]